MAECKPEPMGRFNRLQLQVAGRDEVSSCRSTCALQGLQLRCQGVLSGQSIRHVSLDTGPSLMLQLHLSANPGLHRHDATLLASAVVLVLIHSRGDSEHGLVGPSCIAPRCSEKEGCILQAEADTVPASVPEMLHDSVITSC